MNNDNQEIIWKQLPQYATSTGESTYEVSNTGKVRRRLFHGVSKDGMTGKGKTMPLSIKLIHGRKCVQIRQNLKRSIIEVQTLVDSVFN